MSSAALSKSASSGFSKSGTASSGFPALSKSSSSGFGRKPSDRKLGRVASDGKIKHANTRASMFKKNLPPIDTGKTPGSPARKSPASPVASPRSPGGHKSPHSPGGKSGRTRLQASWSPDGSPPGSPGGQHKSPFESTGAGAEGERGVANSSPNSPHSPGKKDKKDKDGKRERKNRKAFGDEGDFSPDSSPRSPKKQNFDDNLLSQADVHRIMERKKSKLVKMKSAREAELAPRKSHRQTQIDSHLEAKKEARDREWNEYYAQYLEDQRQKRIQEKAIILERPILQQAMLAISAKSIAMKDGFFAVFEEFDIDGNGTISKMELKQGCHALGIKLSPLELTAIMSVFDTDEGGDIDFTEFCNVMKAHAENHPELAMPTGDPGLCGFQMGDRVQALVTVSPPRETHHLFQIGTVIGKGRKQGFILVKLDDGTTLNLAVPRQVQAAKGD